MVHEHDEGRSMEAALDERHPSDFALYADHYVQLLQDHIAKEDNILFAKAETVLTVEDDEALFARFNQIEQEMGEETPERFHRLVDTLASRYLSIPVS